LANDNVGSNARRVNIVRDINEAAKHGGFISRSDAAGFTCQQQRGRSSDSPGTSA
jgi:hypothetical protein